MIVVISGSSGLVGSALADVLGARGHAVKRLVRRSPRTPDEIAWNPERGEIDAKALAGVDGVVNLAGENIAQRWTDDVKRRVRASRMNGTSLLARTIAALPVKPRVFLSGSAVGIYGNRGDELLDESSTVGGGDDFLASVCNEWEAASAPAAAAGIRLVNLRTGIVLAKHGGALAKMLVPFRFGVGGRLGNGRQWMSWIALDDMVHAMMFALSAEALSGAVNMVAPNSVTNAEFTRVLAEVLHRPAFFPVPRAALNLVLGEMADDTVLASQRVAPRRLVEAGYRFLFPTLDAALKHQLP